VKFVFLVSRQPEYRLIAPVVDEVLGRGWRAECWLNHGWHRDGLKAYQFPDLDAAPAFRHGQPHFATYAGDGDLDARLRATDADVVVSCAPPPTIPVGGVDGARRQVWVGLQHTIDFLITYPADVLLACDVIALYSDWWRQWAVEHYAGEATADMSTFVPKLAARSAVTGFTALDPITMIDPHEVRARWGIPKTQPVVVLLPFGQGVGKTAFWPRGIFGEPSRIRQVANVVAKRRFEYWHEARHGARDIDVVRALRRFCDRHGACLLVKSRRKTPIPAYTARLADKCLYDESYYPSTVLEALSVASLCVGYYSATVTEAAPSGVPTLCVTMDADDYCGDDAWNIRLFRRFFNRTEGGVFQFNGVTTTVTPREAIAHLEHASLDSFAMNSDARARYVEKFLAHDDFAASARVVDAAERAVHARADRLREPAAPYGVR
jgi:hypothetical protein